MDCNDQSNEKKGFEKNPSNDGTEEFGQKNVSRTAAPVDFLWQAAMNRDNVPRWQLLLDFEKLHTENGGTTGRRSNHGNETWCKEANRDSENENKHFLHACAVIAHKHPDSCSCDT